MSGIKKKNKLSKRVSLYEKHYSLLYKYPRKSTIHEYYIKNNFLHKIRLSSDINGFDRLRERSKRINYFEVSSKGVKNNNWFKSNDPHYQLNRVDKTDSKIRQSPISIAVRPEHVELRTIFSSNKASKNSFIASKCTNTNKMMTNGQGYQNSLSLETKRRKGSSSKLEKDRDIRRFDQGLIKPLIVSSTEDKQPMQETAVIIENGKCANESEDEVGSTETVFCSKSISISLKEIRQISAGHKCFIQEFPNKGNYCSICDMKLNKYIDQKIILVFNVLNSYTCTEKYDINVTLPIIAVNNGFKLRYTHLKQDYFTYRATEYNKNEATS